MALEQDRRASLTPSTLEFSLKYDFLLEVWVSNGSGRKMHFFLTKSVVIAGKGGMGWYEHLYLREKREHCF